MQMNWFGAQNNCLRKGLNLADLSTQDEFDAIVKFLYTKGNMEDFWFGGNDLQSENHFTYISNGRPVRYLGGINQIEPTQRSNLDDCLEIRLREDSTVVTDDNCQEQQYFICQQNELKCAQPVIDESIGVHHSHEHLHHFHHDTAKAEVPEEEKEGSQESLESDSRPADNSNSTEIGESPESDKGEEAEGDEGDDIGESEGENEGENADADQITESGATKATLEGEEGGATTASQAEGESTALVESSTESAAEAEDATEATAAPEASEAAPAEDTAAAARAPKAIASEAEESDNLEVEEALAPDASPVSVDIGAESPINATEKSLDSAGEESVAIPPEEP